MSSNSYSIVLLIYQIGAAIVAMSIGFLLAPDSSDLYKTLLTGAVFGLTLALY